MENKTIGFIQTSFGHAAVQTSTYMSGGSTAVLLNDSITEQPICTLSVNLPESCHELEPGEFFAKTWSENEEIAKLALTSGLFEDTGRRVPTGFVEAQVWKIVMPDKKDAENASFVQSACNPSGVTRSLLKMLQNGLGFSSPVAVMFASKIGCMARQSDSTPERNSTWQDVTQLAQNAVSEMSNAIHNGTDTDGLRGLSSFQTLAKELRAWTHCDNYFVLSCAQNQINEAMATV